MRFSSSFVSLYTNINIAFEDSFKTGPQGYFPGHNPVRNYCSQLHNMQTRALAQGMTKEQFAAIWASISVQRNGNSDYAYFVVEKALWTWLCE